MRAGGQGWVRWELTEEKPRPDVQEGEETRQSPPGFVPVADGEGRLLFYFDPERDLIQIRVKGRPTVLVDLRMYRPRRPAQGKLL